MRAAIRLAIGLAMVALAAAGCGQGTPARSRPRRGQRRRVHRCVGQCGERRRGRTCVGQVDRDRRGRRPALVSRPAPADAAAIADASLVVYNGGGYDHWVDDVLAGHQGVRQRSTPTRCCPARRRSRPTSTCSTTWRPLRRSPKRSPTSSAQIDPDYADDYQGQRREVRRPGRRDRCRGAGDRVGASAVRRWWRPNPSRTTCCVNAGIADRTPPGFASAVEEGDDPSPADVAAMLDLINTHQVSALLFNPQTETAATKQIEDAARQAALPVVRSPRRCRRAWTI